MATTPVNDGEASLVHATRGYDLASGLGTPDGGRLVAALAGFQAHARR